jgi:hypothetical protein
VTDIHLINWTIEEAELLKAERPQPSDVDPIPSLDEILIWPEGDPSRGSTEPVDVAKSVSIQSTPETVPVLPSSNEAVAAPKPIPASYSPIAVSVSIATSPNIRAEEPEPTLTTAVIKPGIQVAPIDRDRMISLRWVLRDIRSKRLKWWPIHQHDLQSLIELEFVEMHDGIPVLTNKGERAID